MPLHRVQLHANAEASVSYFRNFIFGVEDSLVSTVGLLSGVAIAGVPAGTIFLTGLVLIFVEAFSMAAGSFLSEQSAEGYLGHADHISRRPIFASVVMFISYFIAGFVPLSPYTLFRVSVAFPLSIGMSLASLFVLGVIGASVTKMSIFKGGLRMFVIGGIAIAVGVGVGKFVTALG